MFVVWIARRRVLVRVFGVRGGGRGERRRRVRAVRDVLYGATAHLTAAPELARAHGITYLIHKHAPSVFVRGGDDDQMMLDEILRDRRELMVNGGAPPEREASTAGPRAVF